MFKPPATAWMPATALTRKNHWTPVTAWTLATEESPSTARMLALLKFYFKIMNFLGSVGAMYECPVGHLKVVGLCPTCAHIFLHCHKIPVTRKS
jgi:hypothetical protein